MDSVIFICIFLVVAMVRSDTTEDISSSIDATPTTSSSKEPSLEELKNHEAKSKNNSISPRFLDSLFGLGIGANLLGIHAGAGIGHGSGGYGDLGQGFVGKPEEDQYLQPIYMNPQPPPQVYYMQAPPQYQLPQATLQGIPQGIPQGMPLGTLQGMPQEMPQGRPQDMPQGRPQGMPRRRPQGVFRGMPQGRPQGKPQGLPQGIHQGKPQGILQGLLQGMLQGRPQGKPQGIPKENPQ